MHELAITQSLLEVVLGYAEENKATHVDAIFLRIGILRDIEPEWLKRYFAFTSRGTIAENAEILITIDRITCTCDKCGETYHPMTESLRDTRITCPDCGAFEYELVGGMEFLVQGIEIT
jgi:hydrogenase nickel insertion protein HypA